MIRNTFFLIQSRNYRALSKFRPRKSFRNSTFYKVSVVGVAAVGTFALANYALDDDGKHIQSNSAAFKVSCDSPATLPAAELIRGADVPMRDRMSDFVKNLQQEIVAGLEQVDGKAFRVDKWTRSEGGEGISCVIEEGNVFERGGVNVSVVHGSLKPGMARQMATRGVKLTPEDNPRFFAAGISMVLHPYNPMAPTVHLNYRYFEVVNGRTGEVESWWFGGGSDLTPAYLFDEDAAHFHETYKQVCDGHDATYYPRFKKWCDEYFFIKHRNETRGIGGIFFDDLNDKDADQLFSFVQDAGKAFLPSYVPIIERRKDLPYTPEQKNWQQLRRGRYVEFNLVYDRGTKFGLETPSARTESILISMPLTARWQYQHSPKTGTEESRLLKVLENPQEWTLRKPWWQIFG